MSSAEEPADAKSVVDVRKAAKDGDEVTIIGRIGGDVDPWVKGRAAFLIVDHSLEPCSEARETAARRPGTIAANRASARVEGHDQDRR